MSIAAISFAVANYVVMKNIALASALFSVMPLVVTLLTTSFFVILQLAIAKLFIAITLAVMSLPLTIYILMPMKGLHTTQGICDTRHT